MKPSTTKQLVDAATDYAHRGFRVFPVHSVVGNKCTCESDSCQSVAKHPRILKWLTSATTEPRQIAQWWRQFPNANIGIATGLIPGIFVVDVDGDKGRESLKSLQDQFHWDAATLTAETGNGFHLYLCSPNEAVQNRVAMLPGIDLRGDGGYVIAPPSLHRSGRTYSWKLPKLEITKAPEWLLELATKTNHAKEKGTSMPNNAEETELIGEGERNNVLFQQACTLRASGWAQADIEVDLIDTNKNNCVPPLPEDEVKRIAESACRYAVGKSHKTSAKRSKEEDAMRWFKLDAAKWLCDGGVMVLEDFQRGWYINLIAHAWLQRGKLENDPKKLLKMAGVSDTSQWESSKAEVLDLFEEAVEEGKSYLVHPFYTELWKDSLASYAQKVDAGRRSKEARQQRRALSSSSDSEGENVQDSPDPAQLATGNQGLVNLERAQ